MVEEREPIRLPFPTKGNSGTRIDGFASQIVVWTVSSGRGTSLPHVENGGGACGSSVSSNYFFMGPSEPKETQGVLSISAVKSHESRMTFSHAVEKKRLVDSTIRRFHRLVGIAKAVQGIWSHS